MKKKMMAVILTVLMILCTTESAYAVEVPVFTDGVNYSTVAEETSSLLACILASDSCLVTSVENIQLGEKINLYYTEGGELVPSEYSYFPIIQNGKIVAFSACRISNNKCIAITTDRVDQINQYMKQNAKDFAIAYDGEIAYACSENGVQLLDVWYDDGDVPDAIKSAIGNMRFSGATSKLELSLTGAVLNVGTTLELNIANVASPAAATGYTVDVPAKSQLDNDMICWAACVASVGQQQKNHLNYSAQQVADKMGHSNDGADADIVIDALKEIYSVTSKAFSPPTPATIASDLQKNRPLIFGCEGAFAGHMIVICGLSGSTSTVALRYMDPDGGCFGWMPFEKECNYTYSSNGKTFYVTQAVRIV